MTQERPDSKPDSLGRSAATAAAGMGINLVVWLAPVVILGGLGVLLLNAGTHESTNAFGMTQTEYSGTAGVGFGFIAFAVAAFFGRGSLQGIAKVVRGEGSLTDVLFLRTNLVNTLIALAAIVLGIGFVFIGITG